MCILNYRLIFVIINVETFLAAIMCLSSFFSNLFTCYRIDSYLDSVMYRFHITIGIHTQKYFVTSMSWIGTQLLHHLIHLLKCVFYQTWKTMIENFSLRLLSTYRHRSVLMLKGINSFFNISYFFMHLLKYVFHIIILTSVLVGFVADVWHCFCLCWFFN